MEFTHFAIGRCLCGRDVAIALYETDSDGNPTSRTSKDIVGMQIGQRLTVRTQRLPAGSKVFVQRCVCDRLLIGGPGRAALGQMHLSFAAKYLIAGMARGGRFVASLTEAGHVHTYWSGTLTLTLDHWDALLELRRHDLIDFQDEEGPLTYKLNERGKNAARMLRRIEAGARYWALVERDLLVAKRGAEALALAVSHA